MDNNVGIKTIKKTRIYTYIITINTTTIKYITRKKLKKDTR